MIILDSLDRLNKSNAEHLGLHVHFSREDTEDGPVVFVQANDPQTQQIVYQGLAGDRFSAFLHGFHWCELRYKVHSHA